jgi:hypothetical protein
MNLSQTRPKFWSNKWTLHHDNVDVPTEQLLRRNRTVQASASLSLATCQFSLFCQTKNIVEMSHFGEKKFFGAMSTERTSENYLLPCFCVSRNNGMWV